MKHLHKRLDRLEATDGTDTPSCVIYGPGMDFETFEEAQASIPEDADVAFVGFTNTVPPPDNHPDHPDNNTAQ